MAIADTMFGKYNPSGRLPATVYESSYVDEINLTDMSLTNGPGRTHLYYKGTPEFAFGTGLSYSSWRLQAQGLTDNKQSFVVRLSNTGSKAGRQTVLCFWRPASVLPSTVALPPVQRLFDYSAADLQSGESQDLACNFNPEEHLALAQDNGALALHPAAYELYATLGNGHEAHLHTYYVTRYTPLQSHSAPTVELGLVETVTYV
jgi:hypothetical protein